MPSEAEGHAGDRTDRRGVHPLYLLLVVGAGFSFAWFVVPLAEDYPLLYPPGLLFSISLFAGTFFVVAAAVLWLRRKKAASAAERVVSIAVALFFGLVLALVAMLWLFPILNGALDYESVTQQKYEVAEFVPEERGAGGDCPGSRTIFSGDDSHYLLEPRGAERGDGRIMVGVSCDDDRGLPTDGGEVVPIDGEVTVYVKPGLFGIPWRAGIGAPPGG